MLDIDKWVDEETDPHRSLNRKAMRQILLAIASSTELSPVMSMKGGLLLAIGYRSHRYTRDIDFSTTRRRQDVNVDEFLSSLDKALKVVSTNNEDNLFLGVQTHEIRPSRDEASFPTLKIRIGYAVQTDVRAMKRLRERLAPTIVEIDYSFNEWASKADREPLGDGVLLVYSFHDLIAEKFRAVLQQLFRHRNRYQDIYDLSLLLKMTHINISEEDKKEILDKLFKAAESREGINLCKEAMRDSELIEASRLLYDKELPSMLSNPPPFDTTYRAVRTFFESLPWPKK